MVYIMRKEKYFYFKVYQPIVIHTRRDCEKKMKFIAEFYLTKVQMIRTEVIESDSIEGAVEEAQGKETDYMRFMNVEEV